MVKLTIKQKLVQNLAQNQYRDLVKARILVVNQLLNLVRVQQTVASQPHALVRVRL